MTFRLLLSFIMISFSSISLIAQEKESLNKKKDSYFKFNASYLSNSVYNGRKDSLTLPYITPSIGYFNNSGFYIQGSLSYLNSASESRIDLFSFDIGYDFSLGDNFSGGVYASKYFYNKSSTAVSSENKGGLGSYFSYDFGIISTNGNLDLSFSSKTDFFAGIGLSHAFSFGTENNQFSITPTVHSNWGSQNYYQGYLQNSPGKRNKSNTNTKVSVNQQSSFELLDYEISIPLNYDGNKWGLFITPTYAIPQSPATYTITGPLGNSRTITEKLDNTFYAELGIYIKL